jgi:hypothetical protein
MRREDAALPFSAPRFGETEFRTDRDQIGENSTMKILDSLRKAFSFFLMCMGVSSPAKRTAPAPKPESRP